METIICLGRYGDIINILPILEREHSEGRPKALMVARQFADILDGVSYVQKVVWDGDWKDVRAAHALAVSTGRTVKVWQLAGDRQACLDLAYKAAGLSPGMGQAESFAKEQWRIAGAHHLWREKLPVNFDRRDPDREHEAWVDMMPVTTRHSRKAVLVHLGGETSPYPHSELLWMLIEGQFQPRHYVIIDLTKIKFERLYDVVGCMDRAHCLVTADSVMLHLARASKVPVAAFIQDKPTLWHGSPWFPHHVSHVRYSDLESLPRVVESMRAIGGRGSCFRPRPATLTRIIHVWSTADVIDKTRHAKARETWKGLLADAGAIDLAVSPGMFGRNSGTEFISSNGERAFPYVLDVLRAACQMCESDDDWIVFSRAECAINSEEVRRLISEGKPWVGLRVVASITHAAGDVFGFTKGWWKNNQSDYPDVVMGTDSGWHRILKEMILLEGTASESVCSRESLTRAPVQESAWRTLNDAAVKTWLDRHKIRDYVPSVQTALKTHEVNPAALFPWGYNPSIAAVGKDFLLAYRSHRWGDLRTSLAVARLDANLNVKSNEWIEFGDALSYEDPRFFWHAGALWMSYIRSEYPKALTAEVWVGQLGRESGRYYVANARKVEPPWKPQRMEKNWIFFEREGRLFAIYAVREEQVVLEFDNWTVTKVHKSRPATWNWGSPRGGTSPVDSGDGKLVRIFHSRTDYEFAPTTWRYHVGACLMEASPPFQIVKLSKRPIITASHNDETYARDKCFHHKPAIVFPGGWTPTQSGMLTALGVNDNSSHLVLLNRKDLNL